MHERPRVRFLAAQYRREQAQRRRRHARRPARAVEGRLDGRTLRVARPTRLGHVRPVDRERDQRRDQRDLQLARRDTRVVTREPHEVARQPPDVREEPGLDQPSLASARSGLEVSGRRRADERSVRALDRREACRVDERRLDGVRELVARRSDDGPVVREPFVAREYLLHPHGRGACEAAEAFEIRGRVPEAVDVIDPEPGEPAAREPVRDSKVRRDEHRRILDADADQVAHVEESAVVDLPRRAPPVHEPVRLRVE